MDDKRFLDIDGVEFIFEQIKSKFDSKQQMINELTKFLQDNSELKIERMVVEEIEP